MSVETEADERSEKLLRDAASVFWENYFHKPLPHHDRRLSLPSIPEKKAEASVIDDPVSPTKRVFSPSKNVMVRFPLKGVENRKGQASSEKIAKTQSLDLDEPLRPSTRANLQDKAAEMKRSFSTDGFDSAKHRRAQRSVKIQRHLPAILKKEPGPTSSEVTQQRAITAIVRADLLHGRREGSVDELDDLQGFSISGKSDAGGLRGTSSRSNSQKSFKGSSRNSTPSTSRRNSFDAEPVEAATLQDIIESSPALQDAIAANKLLPSFARNTITSLIQRIRTQDLSLNSTMIALEKSKNMHRRPSL